MPNVLEYYKELFVYGTKKFQRAQIAGSLLATLDNLLCLPDLVDVRIVDFTKIESLELRFNL